MCSCFADKALALSSKALALSSMVRRPLIDVVSRALVVRLVAPELEMAQLKFCLGCKTIMASWLRMSEISSCSGGDAHDT